MNTISWSDFVRLPSEKRREALPVLITMDGETYALAARPEDVLFIGDMHPRVKIQLKAREALARRGMPKTEDHKVLLALKG